jgi:hypothetical protein
VPRFVVLEHHWRGVHWDLMLQWGETLRTWALEHSPLTTGPIPATPLPDHRLRYLDYEGPISGGRGSVVQWDRGTYELLAETESGVQVRLTGSRLNGEFEVVQQSGTGQWRFCRLES